MNSNEQIGQARDILKSAGYYVDELWSIHDVKSVHPCTDEEAYDILKKVMTSPSIMESVMVEIFKETQK